MKPKSFLLFLLLLAPSAPSAAEEAIDAARAAATVSLTEEGARNLNIQTIEASEDVFEETAFALGRIEEIPSRHAVLSSRIAGRVIEIKAIEGDVVEAGQVLVRVESRQPGNPPPIIELKAPMGGLVAQSHIRLGEPVEPDKELLDIADLHELWAVARVPEHHAASLALGSVAHIRVPALGERRIKGELLRFGTAADTASGTIDAVFRVPNPDLRLRQGMRAEFDLVSDRRENVLSVPREAVQGGPADRHVFVKDFDLPNAYVRTPVRTGRTCGGKVEILSGIFPGDLVVTTGSYPLGFVGGGGSMSIKEQLDKAHGHDHNEDGTVKGGGGEGGAKPAPVAKDEHAEHDEEGTTAVGSPKEKTWVWTSIVLAVLLLASLFGRRSHAKSETQATED